MGWRVDLWNFVSCIIIGVSILLYYILTKKIDNTQSNRTGSSLEFSETLMNYRASNLPLFLFYIPVVFIIFILIQLHNKSFIEQLCFNFDLISIILVSITLVVSFFAINYSLNDIDYFIITINDVIVLKNISIYILLLFLNCFAVLTIVLFNYFFPIIFNVHKSNLMSIYAISMGVIVICEIVVVIKVYNIYYSSKRKRLKVLDNLYYYRLSDLSKNEYIIRNKNYIDGVYYLADKLHKCLTKNKISDIKIIQPTFGTVDYYVQGSKISGYNLIKSIFTRLYICDIIKPLVMMVLTLFIPTSFVFAIIKYFIIIIFIIISIMNYIKLKEMIKKEYDGIIREDNEVESFVRRHIGMDAIIVYEKKYSTIVFEKTVFANKLSKNIINFIIYLRVLFIALKQNYPIDEYNNKINEITDMITKKFEDDEILSTIVCYLIITLSEYDRIESTIRKYKEMSNSFLLNRYRKAIKLFKINCFNDDLEMYNKLIKLL